MLDIGWVFQNELGFRELIVSLSKSPQISVYKTDLVLALVEIFGEKYTQAILRRCFVPYLVYFLLSLLFFTNFTSVGIHTYSEEEQAIALIMGFLIIMLDLYFLFYEFTAMMRSGTVYFTEDLFNYIDLISAVLNAGLVFATLLEKESEATSDRSTIRNYAVIAVLTMWTNSLDWLNL